MEHGLAREVGVEAEVLRQVAQLTMDAARVGDDVLTVEDDGSGRGLEQPGDDVHQGGLPCAVGPEEAEHALRDFERDTLQRRYLTRSLI